MRLSERELAREVVIAGVQLLEGDGLAGRFCAQGAEGAGDGLAVFLVALESQVLAEGHIHPGLDAVAYIALQH